MRGYKPDTRKLKDPEYIRRSVEEFEKREMTAEDHARFDKAVAEGRIVLPPDWDDDGE